MAVNCSDDLKLYDQYVQTCEFMPSAGSDVHNYWYSPFHADGIGDGNSSAYTLPPDASGTPPAQVNRTTFSTSPPTIACNASASSKPMCINVDSSDQNKLATTPPGYFSTATGRQAVSSPGDFPGGFTYDDDSTCTAAGGRWITGPTAFAPTGNPLFLTTYEVRGCALSCLAPDLTGLNIEVVEENKNFSDDFSVKFRCIDDYGPPLDISPAVFHPGDRELMKGAGMDAEICNVEGGTYSLNYPWSSTHPMAGRDGHGTLAAPPCEHDCILPTDGSSGVYPGYDLVNTEISLATVNLGLDLDASVVSRHLICADGYTRRDGDAVSVCSDAGLPIIINDETSGDGSGGCIADCKASSREAFHWSPDGQPNPNAPNHEFHLYQGHYKWQDPSTGDALEISPTSPDQSTIPSSCPTGYESGPGSDVGLSPTYEPCGNLPGHVSSDISDFSIAARSTYGLTGCYPQCDSSSDLCYNYKTERTLDLTQDPMVGNQEELWRTQMGEMLTGATSAESSPLDDSNISFVRRQVLNNESDLSVNQGKEIFEWQIKCSNQQCTNNPAEAAKININEILGPDGIPGSGGITNCTSDPCQYTRYPDTSCLPRNYPDDIIEARNGDTERSAQAVCNGLDDCVGFTYMPRRGGAAARTEILRSINFGGPHSPRAAEIGAACYEKQLTAASMANFPSSPASPVSPVPPPPPAPPPPPPPSWHLGSSGQSCTQTCDEAGGLTCTSGSWGVYSDTIFDQVSGDIMQNNPAGALTCDPATYFGVSSPSAPYLQLGAQFRSNPDAGSGQVRCFTSNRESDCSATTSGLGKRLCKCEG